MGPTTLFDTIHMSHYIISNNFYLYLQYFQQKKSSFSKISRFETDPKYKKKKMNKSKKSSKRIGVNCMKQLLNVIALDPNPC